MSEGSQDWMRKMREERQLKEQLFTERLNRIPFEQRTSALVLELIQEDGDLAEHVWKAISTDQFPSDALTLEVAMALPKSTYYLGKTIHKFLTSDHQKILEHWITQLPSGDLGGFVNEALNPEYGSVIFDRRTITELLLRSNIHRYYILTHLDRLDLTPEDIKTVINQSLDGGYIESVIRVLDTIPNLDEEEFIKKLLTHEEKELNAIKILSGLSRFHISKDRLINLFQVYLTDSGRLPGLIETLNTAS